MGNDAPAKFILIYHRLFDGQVEWSSFLIIEISSDIFFCFISPFTKFLFKVVVLHTKPRHFSKQVLMMIYDVII